MQIHSLKLQNFRSYKKLNIKLGKNTILVGANAQGKTNLLEAIYLTSVGKSFRGKECDMVFWDETFFRIEAESENAKPIKIEYIYEANAGSGRKTVKINGVKKASSALLDGLKCIFFSPDETDMFFGFPAERRRHFNIFISQINKEYARELINYRKVLEHRNALLRKIGEGRAKAGELEIWDGKLAEHSSKIISERRKAADGLNKTLAGDYKKVAGGKEDLMLEYSPAVWGGKDGKTGEDFWAIMLKTLIKSREKDLALKATTAGPHRDGFAFRLQGKNAETFASRGELRSVILALKLSEAMLLEEKTRERPVLLLDDVFSELDELRRRHLAKTFNSQQTIVTTTDLDHIDKSLRKTALIYKIESGKAEKVS